MQPLPADLLDPAAYITGHPEKEAQKPLTTTCVPLTNNNFHANCIPHTFLHKPPCKHAEMDKLQKLHF
jgi:hypothetical protein